MRFAILIICYLILMIPRLANSQEVIWQNTIGGSSWEDIDMIVQSPDGGFLIGGYSLSGLSGDKTEDSHGGGDIWIVKTDKFGFIQWQNTIGGDDNDGLSSIDLTPDGGYILGCHSRSGISFDKTEACQGDDDFWVIKIDSLGSIQWQNTIGGNKRDNTLNIISTSDGGYLAGGTSFSDSSGDKTEGCIGGLNADFWILKLDSVGNITWQNTIGGTGGDWLCSVAQCSDSGYIIGGTSSSDISGDKTENSRGGNDYWILKLDTTGNILWQKTIGGNQEDVLGNVYEVSDGGFILGGDSDSGISGDKTEASMGLRDYWIVKLDSIGNIHWQNAIGGNSVDMFGFLNLASDGGYYLCGGSYSDLSGDKNEDCDDCYDFWVLKTDSVGEIVWQNTIAGDDTDHARAILETNDGDVLVGGSSRSNISKDKTEPSMGWDDYWILKLSDKYNSIIGTLFCDDNVNNVFDPTENLISNKIVRESVTGRFAFSNLNGIYTIAVLDSGLYSVYNDFINYYNVNPLINQAGFNSFQQVDSLNDFAFQPTGIYNDLCISIIPVGNFRSGFDAYYYLYYTNQGTTTLSPTVIFYPDSNISYLSANPAPTAITPDSVVWDIAVLYPWEVGQILVTANVNTGLGIGTLINSGAVIEPIAGDANSSCNQSYWEVFTTGSFDPNDILVNTNILTTNEVLQGDFLHYIIRFQNTGNDTAFFVNILNPIDTNLLDLQTFEYISASHPVSIEWVNWEMNMKFKLENILLPDSNTNEVASHGFVHYRIKPKNTLIAGNIIHNFAAIYFDYNIPVITNTVATVIVFPTGIVNKPPTLSYLHLYPNPANSVLYVTTGSPFHSTGYLSVSDLLGRKVLFEQLHSNAKTATLDISGLSRGIYFIEYISEGVIQIGRFVIE